MNLEGAPRRSGVELCRLIKQPQGEAPLEPYVVLEGMLERNKIRIEELRAEIARLRVEQVRIRAAMKP